jgi:hypothetical protein
VKRTRWNPRKVLVASAGVATVNYALATGCDSGMNKMSVIANLMPAPGGFGGATVANLVAPPPDPPIEIPPVGGASSLDAGHSPTDASTPIEASAPSDASAPDAAPIPDAAADSTGNTGDAAGPTVDGGP